MIANSARISSDSKVVTNVSFCLGNVDAHVAHKETVVCQAFSADMRKLALCVNHGLTYFIDIPDEYEKTALVADVDASADPPTVGPLRLNATPGVNLGLTHIAHPRMGWQRIALRNVPELLFAVMDSLGSIFIFEWTRDGWQSQKVRQHNRCTVYGNFSQASLEWDRDPSIRRLHMKTFYGDCYFFEWHQGWFREYWWQSSKQVVQG